LGSTREHYFPSLLMASSVGFQPVPLHFSKLQACRGLAKDAATIPLDWLHPRRSILCGFEPSKTTQFPFCRGNHVQRIETDHDCRRRESSPDRVRRCWTRWPIWSRPSEGNAGRYVVVTLLPPVLCRRYTR